MRRRRAARRVGGVALLVASLTACGATERSASVAAPSTTAPTTATTAWTDVTATTVADTTTSVPAPKCGPITVEDVADALGVEPAEVLVGHAPTGEATCELTAGRWTVTSTVAGLVPDIPTTAPPPASTVPGLRSRSLMSVQMERGGRFIGRADLLHDGVMYTVRVSNMNAGSDTYPPQDGPPQGAPTRAVTIALARALDSHL